MSSSDAPADSGGAPLSPRSDGPSDSEGPSLSPPQPGDSKPRSTSFGERSRSASFAFGAPPGGRKLRKDETKEGILPEDVKSAEDLSVDPSVVMSGFMNKRSDQGLFKNWRKRWVVLSVSPGSALLYYFQDQNAANPNGAR